MLGLPECRIAIAELPPFLGIELSQLNCPISMGPPFRARPPRSPGWGGRGVAWCHIRKSQKLNPRHRKVCYLLPFSLAVSRCAGKRRPDGAGGGFAQNSARGNEAHVRRGDVDRAAKAAGAAVGPTVELSGEFVDAAALGHDCDAVVTGPVENGLVVTVADRTNDIPHVSVASWAAPRAGVARWVLLAREGSILICRAGRPAERRPVAVQGTDQTDNIIHVRRLRVARSVETGK
jgi:hypothetical protein